MLRPSLLIFCCALVGCGQASSSYQDRPSQQNIKTSVAKPFKKQEVLIFTPVAAEMVREIIHDLEPAYLRVSVTKGGCTGFLYNLRIDEKFDPENDMVLINPGFTAVVDKTSALFLQGTTIDYQSTAEGTKGFKFENPNALVEKQ